MKKQTKRNNEIKQLRNQGWTFQKIGEKYGICRERVRQIYHGINSSHKISSIKVNRNI